MAEARDVSRRAFITGIAGLAATSRLSAADLPFVVKRVEKLYKIAGCKQPNDLQFVADGLWVLDQVDPNKAFKVRPDTGSIIQELQTESIHGSGITYGNGALWITSTKMTDPKVPPRTLKVDAKTGKTLKSWATPGSGLYGKITALSTPSGGPRPHREDDGDDARYANAGEAEGHHAGAREYDRASPDAVPTDRRRHRTQ